MTEPTARPGADHDEAFDEYQRARAPASLGSRRRRHVEPDDDDRDVPDEPPPGCRWG